MLFNSYIFIFAFLPIALVGYGLVRNCPNRLWAIAWLVLASLFYYGWWKPEFLALLGSSIVVNAVLGNALCSGRLSRTTTRVILVTGLTFNLALLGYFKYAGFFVENLNTWFGAGWSVPKILLPIGISFITFQKIAFLVDAYRGLIPTFSLPNYTLFVTFFPQLIAGPIIHHAEVMPQFEKPPEKDGFRHDLAVGVSIFIMGLFKKVVVADAVAVYADAGYGSIKAGHPLDPASAWITILAFSLQLYYDFSGYSDMAIGLGRMFGFRLPANFHSPYKATNIIDFWRRWHITLSRFLRDYIYIPLGGNRHGIFRRYANLMLVMLIGGLWHGANWTFVIWGAVHGVMLSLNHAWGQVSSSRFTFLDKPWARAISILLTFTFVTLAWVPFRSESLQDTGKMFAALFPFGNATNPANVLPSGIRTLLELTIATFLLPNSSQFFAKFDPVLGLTSDQLKHSASLRKLTPLVAVVLSGVFIYCVLCLSHVSPFLYFQF